VTVNSKYFDVQLFIEELWRRDDSASTNLVLRAIFHIKGMLSPVYSIYLINMLTGRVGRLGNGSASEVAKIERLAWQ